MLFPCGGRGIVLSLLFAIIVVWSDDRIRLQWSAPFLSGGGYCSEAMAFINSISTTTNISLVISHHGDSYNEDYMEGLTEKDKHLLNTKYERDSDSKYRKVVICHSEPGAWYTPYPNYHTSVCPPPEAVYKIGRTMFETDRIPDGWIPRLNYMDEIWVPTVFAKEIFIKEGIPPSKLVVVGEPVDTDFYKPLYPYTTDIALFNKSERSWKIPRSLTNIPLDRFIFLFVGKWEERKGIKILLRAYFREFTASDKVALVMLTSSYHSTDDFHTEVKRFLVKDKLLSPSVEAPVYLILSGIPQRDMPALYALADVLVIPSRGEGWGRPHVEAMSCGVPVVATHWGGPTEYLTEDNGFPLRTTGLTDSKQWKGHRWADPDEAHLRELLRLTSGDVEEVRRKGRRAREAMTSRYSLPVMGGVIARELDRIMELLLPLTESSGRGDEL